MQLVIFAWGNPTRGDDGLGPAMAHRIRAFLEQHPRHSGVEIVEDVQLQVEHALDLENGDLALFIDASAICDPPFAFTLVQRFRETHLTSHVLSPEALLQVYFEIHGGEAPPSFLLSVRGDRFELGEGLGETAQANLRAAWSLAEGLFQDIDAHRWELLRSDRLEGTELGNRMDHPALPQCATGVNSR